MVRVKQRYIVMEVYDRNYNEQIDGQIPFSNRDIINSVHTLIEELHGDYGAGLTTFSTKILYWNSWTRIAILRCMRDQYNLVVSSLPFLKAINNIYVSIRSLHISGTIRSCQKFIISYNRQQLTILKNKINNSGIRRRAIHSLKNIPLDFD